MKYNKEERVEIGRRIYQGELTTAMAAEEYGINLYTARDYLRLYKASINVAIPKEYRGKTGEDTTLSTPRVGMEEYDSMTREELIDELIKSKVNEARAKKGYEVKGGGLSKEYKPLGNKSMK